jgi:hypothetical protein
MLFLDDRLRPEDHRCYFCGRPVLSWCAFQFLPSKTPDPAKPENILPQNAPKGLLFFQDCAEEMTPAG